MAEAGRLRVTVAYSPAAREVHAWALELPAGATVAQALAASGLAAAFPQLGGNPAPVGIWGRRVEPGDALRDQDRVEVYRPLQVDPKESRRHAAAAASVSGRK